ncbi:OLC1v1037315C1 [Oldenlandia corymbosa var. corymbosa]|uniref:OLC1v1037315C1 n=1 Tax=Oldenlandia corymbosa var. corymbosa TaxID=529605 RepID=A0AAV1CY23_OLDCO|nr:OLC1v1037315C1 [Oldenlandia corymbosa var. corymbosa]
MHHPKSELDFTGSTPSTPYSHVSSSASHHPVYFVQSPSRYSHDASSRMASVQASPVYGTSPKASPIYNTSPSESPFHSSNPRSSSASRFSGNWRYLRINRKRAKGWPEMESKVIPEDDDPYTDHGVMISPYLLAIIGSALVFGAVCLILWGISRPYAAQISIQRLRVYDFDIGEGSDQTGVPTKFLTLNCTTVTSIHNPATFYGIYVTFELIDIMYLEVTVATGELKSHYQPRKSSRNIGLEIEGNKVPLYGAGAVMEDGKEVPLKLNMEIHSCGYLMGGLVKTKRHWQVSCSFVFNPQGTRDILFQQDSCTYD